MILLALQVLLPILLIATIAFIGRHRLLKIMQIVATALLILVVQLAGLWLLAPWWTAWLLWLLLGLAAWSGWRRTRSEARLGVPGAMGLVVACLAAAGFGWLVFLAWQGRHPPQGPVVELASPFPRGSYLVVNGGSRPLINAHLETLEPKTPRQARYRGQSLGLDIVALTPAGLTADGWQPREPERHEIFGTPLLAPCRGVVVSARGDRPDMPVPITDQEVMTGNHVHLRCSQADVVLAHLRRGSLRVAAGQRVEIGTALGEVGNSGNSDVPHLHIHAQRPESAQAPFASDPLPMRIAGRYLVRGDRFR